MNPLIQYQFYVDPDQLQQPSTAAIEYWVAQNGVFVRGQRPELEALLPVSRHENPVRGLGVLQPFVALTQLNSVWLDLVSGIAKAELPNEVLFHWTQTLEGNWELTIPDQTQSQFHCQPVEVGYDSSAHRAVLEIHSHGRSPAYFSQLDDDDENNGFRIYGVLGRLHQAQPELLLRVELFGHFWMIPASAVFDSFESGCTLLDVAHPKLPYYSAKEPDHADDASQLTPQL